MQDVPYVDAGGYRTADGQQLSLFLVNRSARRDAQVGVDPGFQPFTVESITTLTADTYLAENSPENPDNVRAPRHCGTSDWSDPAIEPDVAQTFAGGHRIQQTEVASPAVIYTVLTLPLRCRKRNHE